VWSISGRVVSLVGGWVGLDLGLEVEMGLPLGTERRPRNLIMGVCLERIWVARIFAVAYVCLCDLWCVELRKWFVLVKKCGCAREDLVFWR
jgi:hypothetical protein